MGVPKFFRYISERYPCLSELVKEYQIPDFDNLYLDMNGIIHTCSHPDDYDPHFRISEEQIFKDIFHYIEVLFRMIKPQKLFFMAVDGVAPRAKMNQQRGRRFRSARESQKLEAKAMQRGESLPEEARFDSNCITPGTEFMAKLQQQLKYFVVTKITTDKLWRKCQIVLSGPETPGEGEHKIMDYIRYMRSQPGYDPNTRHCLYGLDADLIMLGLCTHEPHFSLLREEVRFGKKNNKRKSIPEQITFYLLHLSLMREYLELEFKSVKDRLSFRYDIDSIIDDWVLMGFLVGNDFIPHLPNLHIANGALPMLYNAYMKVLPELDGYINEGGFLNLERFEKFMEALRNIDMDHFSEQYADLKYFEEKTGRKWGQKEKKLEAWQSEVPEENLISLEPEPPRKPMCSELEALINKTNEMFLEPSEENLKDLATNEDVDDDDRINYLESDCDSTDGTEDGLLDAEFEQHKKDYYMNKLDYAQVTPEVLRAQAEGYVTAIQWNLHYYYNGVCSWSWYYPHHYAPFISDIKDFKNYKFNFELGEPFKPYEQLLAVLPSASKSLLPECYWNLMTEDASLIKEYYPVEFNTDLNGKKQDWEAVVLIPFIDEKNLLEAMEPCNQLLSAEEVKRNTHGPMLIYSYTDANGGAYEAPEYFPALPNHHAQWRLVSRDEIRVEIADLVKGAYPGAKMDVYFPGFPTMKHLKYSSRLEKAKVKVFDQPSRNESMILTVESSAGEVIDAIATNMLGKEVYVGWPHLVEAVVVAVSNRNFKYNKAGNDGEYNVEENKGNAYDLEKHAISEHYKDRMGVDVGDIDILIHVKIMTGRKYIFTPQGRVNLERQWSDVNSAYPLQLVVKDIKVYCEKYKMFKNIEEVFPIGSTCYMIGHPHYGCLATVLDSKESLKKGRVKVRIKYKASDPDFEKVREMEDTIRVNYMPLHIAAGRLKISRHVLSRVTGCLLVTLGSKEDAYNQDASRVNIGLDLKYNKKNEEIPGYTRKEGREWLYSQKTVELVKEFMNLYPRLFEYLSYNSNEDVFYESDLFPEDQGSGETIKEIQKWVKKLPTASIERQACGTLVLEPDVVQLIEQITSDYDAEEEKESVVMQVKPHLLFRPDIQIGHMAPDAAATYRLYDRVVNIRESYTVPLGYTGTVIAIHQPATGKLEDTMYDVVFDKPFAGGVALNCSPNRGYRMSNFSLINKSHGRRKVENKVGTPGLLRQQLSGMSQPTMKQIIQQSQQQQQSNGNQQGSAFASWNNGPPPPQNQNFYMPQQNYNYQQQQQKSFNNYAFPQTAPVSLPSKRFDFMPNFAPKVPSNSGEQFGTQASYKNEDADALKKLLKIGEPGDFGASPPRIKPTAASSGPAKDSSSVTVQDLFAHAKANPPKPEKPPSTQPPQKTSCSLDLLLYFQSEGLGCPHYKYFNLPGQNQYRAELMIPSSGELLLGDPASTKEEACENVARIMLQTLKNKQTVNAGMPVNFPNPPKQWWEPGNSQQETKRWPGSENVRPNHSSFQRGGQDEKEYPLLEREKPTKPLRQKQAEAVPFVPLQAVKQQRVAKPGSSNPSTPANKSRNSNGSEPTRQPKHGGSPKKNASANEPAENANAPKPRRKREMRIAANFHFNPKLA